LSDIQSEEEYQKSQVQALPITLLGDPVLRQHTKAVKDISAPEIQVLIDDMLATVQAAHGAGLAAPQVGVSLSIFIVCPDAGRQRYPHASIQDTLVVINPKLEKVGNKRVTDWEACLSIPGIRGKVPRFERIRITYQNRLGEHCVEEYDGFTARVFQHEYDHLQGQVFFDRMNSLKSLMMDEEFVRQMEAGIEDI